MVERSDTVEFSTSSNATCQVASKVGLINTKNTSTVIFTNFTGEKMGWSEVKQKSHAFTHNDSKTKMKSKGPNRETARCLLCRIHWINDYWSHVPFEALWCFYWRSTADIFVWSIEFCVSSRNPHPWFPRCVIVPIFARSFTRFGSL